MKRARCTRGTGAARIVTAAVVLMALGASAQVPSPSIDWFTIDGGGELVAEGGNWTLSGTIGQADATTTGGLAGGAWSVIGGFWSITADPSDRLFSDGFESGGTTVAPIPEQRYEDGP